MTSYSTVRSESYSYSTSDIEDVVRRFTADTRDGYLSGIDADVTFETAELLWKGKEISSTKGVLQLRLPAGALFPRSATLAPHYVSVDRGGSALPDDGLRTAVPCRTRLPTAR